MKLNLSTEKRSAQAASINAICIGASLLMPLAAYAGPSSPEPVAEEEEVATNWIEVEIGGASVDGNDAAYQRRFTSNGDFYGGIKSFRFEQLTDDGIFLMEGHAMFGLEDYELELRYDKDDVGFIRFGYKEFRTWYDGSGGYAGPGVAPPEDWMPLYDDELSLDRGEVWFEGGLRMPDFPQLTLGYKHQWRKGEKDSTSWGRSARGNVPSYYDIDETRDILTLDILHTLGKTDLGVGLRYQNIKNDNTHNMYMSPGAADVEDDRKVAQTDETETDIFNAHIFSETRFSERSLLSFGYSFTSLDGEFEGERTSIDRDGVSHTETDHAYTDLAGDSETDIHIFNANYWWNPIDDLVIVPSIRGEFWDQSVMGKHLAGVRNQAGVTEDVRDGSNNEWDTFTEQLELRYTGIDNILIYGKAELSQTEGDMDRDTYVDGVIDAFRTTESDTDQQKYTVGANWYPCRGVSIASQYYFRRREQDFDHVVDGDDAQLNQHNSDTNDFNLRVTWRAASNLTFVSRYDYQQTDFENQAFSSISDASSTLTNLITSGDSTRHIFSESVSWTPTNWMYLQGNFSWVQSTTDTDADDQSGVDSRYWTDWENDYWMVSLNAGFVLDERTQLQVGYFYYDSDNYENNSAVGTPVGSNAAEHAVTVRLTRQINSKVLLNVGYGYFKGEDSGVGGGFNDYEAHVVSTGFRFSF